MICDTRHFIAYATIGPHKEAHRGDVPEGPEAGPDRRGKDGGGSAKSKAKGQKPKRKAGGEDRSGKDDGRSAKPEAKGQKPKRKTVGAGEATDGKGFLHSAEMITAMDAKRTLNHEDTERAEMYER